jgi:hypothetical protein
MKKSIGPMRIDYRASQLLSEVSIALVADKVNAADTGGQSATGACQRLFGKFFLSPVTPPYSPAFNVNLGKRCNHCMTTTNIFANFRINQKGITRGTAKAVSGRTTKLKI